MSFHGNVGAELLSDSPRFIHGQGWSTVRRYKGREFEINALIPQLVGDGWEIRGTVEQPWVFLTATRQTRNDPDEFYDRFVVSKESLQKDIWTKELVQDEVETVWIPTTGSTFQDYRSQIEDAINECDDSLLPSSATYPVAHQVYRELARGADSYEEEYVVLTRERVVGLSHANKLQLRNTNTATIYTEAELVSNFFVPLPLPGVTLPSQPSIVPDNTKWGWRARRHEINFIEGQKAEVTQDWALAFWSTFLYTPLTP